MKVESTKVSDSEISASIDLELDKYNLKRSLKAQVKEDIGQFLKEQVLLSVSEQKSPIAGESFPRLSKDYKSKKDAEGYTPVANLEATGDMLNSFDVEVTKKGIKLGVFGDQAPKADGHNNLSGASSLPKRRFIPDVDQTFKRDITSAVERIIADAMAENTTIDLKGVESKEEFYSALSTAFPGLTRAKIVDTLKRNPDLMDEIGDFEEWL